MGFLLCEVEIFYDGTMNKSTQACAWRVRRVAAGLRQLDVCLASGISQARYSALERCEAEPTEAERREIERILPHLPLGVMEQLRMGQSP